jgi:hypothetical protein
MIADSPSRLGPRCNLRAALNDRPAAGRAERNRSQRGKGTETLDRLRLASMVCCAWLATPLSAQSVTVRAVGEMLHVTAPGFGFIRGEALSRLKDGQSLRVDLAFSVVAKPGGAAAAETRQTFLLSYDLWEERFAVTRAGTPAQSISHVTSAGAEAWCVERLSIPLSALGRLGRDAPFWVRLEYRVQGLDDRPEPSDGATFTLRGLIDALSRRPSRGSAAQSIEAGPFPIPR